MTDIKDVVAHLHELNEEEKQLKSEKEKLRQELFSYADSEQSEFLLPTTTIEVPRTFWYATKLSPQEFLASRFPTWDLISHENDPTRFVDILVLRKKKEFMPWKYEDEDYSLSKTPIEPTPEIDWDTLEQERPELSKRLKQAKVIYEINEEELNNVLQEDPTVYEVLRRHSTFTKTPSQRVGVKLK
jgi:hypothetical protein